MAAVQSDRIEYTYRGRLITVRPPYHGGDPWTIAVDGIMSDSTKDHPTYSAALLAAEAFVDAISE